MTIDEIVKESKIFPALRAASGKTAIKIIEALIEGGLRVIEITMSVPGAFKVLEEAVNKFKDDRIIFGIGTVLDSSTARTAILAGAEFIVSPITDYETIKLCNSYGIPFIPGASTPTEIFNAARSGASAVKVFPCNSLGGPEYIKSVLAVMPFLKLIPSGGVNLDTISKFLKNGAIAVAAGNNLINIKTEEEGNFKKITELSRQYLEAAGQ